MKDVLIHSKLGSRVWPQLLCDPKNTTTELTLW